MERLSLPPTPDSLRSGIGGRLSFRGCRTSPSDASPAPRTPRPSSSPWPWRRSSTSSSTTSSPPRGRCPASARCARPGSSPRSSPGTRAPSSARMSSSIADGVLPALVQEIAEVTTTRVEPEVLRAPDPGAVVRRATGDERAHALYFDQMDKQGSDRDGRDGDADLPQPRVPRRHARRARVDQRDLRRRRRRRASRCSCCTRSSSSGVLGDAVGEREGARLQRQGRGPAVPRPPQPAAGRRSRRRLRRARAARRAVRRRRASTPRRRPTTRAGARTSRAGPRASTAFWWTLARVLRGASCCPTSSPTPRTSATSTRWSIHHGDGAAAAGGDAGRRRRRLDRGQILRTYDELVEFIVRARSPTRTPGATGPVRSPAPARSTRSCGACVRR